MVAVVVLALALAAGEGAEPGAEAARQAVRPRLAIGLLAVGGYGSASPMLAANAGLTGDLGLTFGDELSLSVRLTAAFGVGATLAGGLSVDWAATERLQLGVGLSYAVIGGMLDQPITAGLVIPLRVAWMFSERPAAATARRGFFVFGELAPGASLLTGNRREPVVPGTPRSPRSPFGFLATVAVGVGYATW